MEESWCSVRLIISCWLLSTLFLIMLVIIKELLTTFHLIYLCWWFLVHELIKILWDWKFKCCLFRSNFSVEQMSKFLSYSLIFFHVLFPKVINPPLNLIYYTASKISPLVSLWWRDIIIWKFNLWKYFIIFHHVAQSILQLPTTGISTNYINWQFYYHYNSTHQWYIIVMLNLNRHMQVWVCDSTEKDW